MSTKNPENFKLYFGSYEMTLSPLEGEVKHLHHQWNQIQQQLSASAFLFLHHSQEGHHKIYIVETTGTALNQSSILMHSKEKPRSEATKTQCIHLEEIDSSNLFLRSLPAKSFLPASVNVADPWRAQHSRNSIVAAKPEIFLEIKTFWDNASCPPHVSYQILVVAHHKLQPYQPHH